MVIISPYEAQELLPRIGSCNKVTLHIYKARQNLGFNSLDSLNLCATSKRPQRPSIPRHLIQLNLFAGQLYFPSFEEYTEMCNFLNIAWQKAGEDLVVAADGFIIHDTRSNRRLPLFQSSPVKFLKMLLTKIQRNCDEIGKTHMGKILDSNFLLPSDFDELGEKLKW